VFPTVPEYQRLYSQLYPYGGEKNSILFIVHVPSILSGRHTALQTSLCKLFPMPQPSHHCCERTHHCACTVVVALTQIRRLTNGSDHANLIWLITSEVLPPSAIRKREIIVNIFFSVVQQLNLAVGCLIVEVSRSLTHTHTHTRQDSSKRVISSSQRMHLTQRKTLKRRTSMFSAGFEPSIPQSSDSITLTYTGRPPKSVVSLLEAVFRRDSWNYHVCYAECRLSLNSRDGKCNTTWSAKKYLNAAGHC